MDFSKYKFRCHYQGNLVSAPKPLSETSINDLNQYRERKNGIGKELTEKQNEKLIELEYKFLKSSQYELSTTAKKLLTEIVFSEKFGRSYQLENKYFEKGSFVEKESRDLLSDVLGTRLIADKERKSNEWVNGERDIKSSKVIIDIKSTWDFITFSNHIIDSNEEHYFRQLDCYMDLWAIKDSLLAFVLTDTPIDILNREITNTNFKKRLIDENGNAYDSKIPELKRIVENHIFSRKRLEEFCNQSGTIRLDWFSDFNEVTIKDRVHLVPHSFDPIRIEQRNECLRLGREFMNTIKPINNLSVDFKLL